MDVERLEERGVKWKGGGRRARGTRRSSVLNYHRYTLRDGDKFSIIEHFYYYTYVVSFHKLIYSFMRSVLHCIYSVRVKEKKVEGSTSGWKNYQFYKNMIPSKPDGATISEMHSNVCPDMRVALCATPTRYSHLYTVSILVDLYSYTLLVV